MNYLTQNAKMARSSVPIFNFGIPAYRSESGFVTCPMAGECLKGCYAQQGAYLWSNVKPAYERRLELTKREDFAPVMIEEILRRKIQAVRIHDSGDFYSPLYFGKWLHVAFALPCVQFYAYTKMVKMVKSWPVALPKNLTIIFSEGGKQDHLIESGDRHSRVFATIEDLKASHYADTTHDDAQAFGNNPRIGLVYHGAKSKTWTTERGAA